MVDPWVPHQAGVLHAISLISMKLGQFKGSTPKLNRHRVEESDDRKYVSVRKLILI